MKKQKFLAFSSFNAERIKLPKSHLKIKLLKKKKNVNKNIQFSIFMKVIKNQMKII